MHLKLLEKMMHDQLPLKLSEAGNMARAFDLVRSYPTIGDFLAYQYVTDVNYSELTDFSEDEFTVAGPGARDGISKCFLDLGGLSYADVIRIVMENQESHMKQLGIQFKNLWGRPLQLIDVQNIFCEISKYARVAHPEVPGLSARIRIKQRFKPMCSPVTAWFPPKWKLNGKIEDWLHRNHNSNGGNE